MIRALVTLCGAGYLRPASGTWASAIAVALAVLAYEAGLALLVPLGAMLATVAGFLALPRYLASRPGADPSEVVIDEVAGQWLALSFTVIPLWWHGVQDLFLGAWPGWVVPFLMFRLFDIWKPWPIREVDHGLRGGLGIMLDDVMAGLMAAGLLLLLGRYAT